MNDEAVPAWPGTCMGDQFREPWVSSRGDVSPGWRIGATFEAARHVASALVDTGSWRDRVE